MNEIKVTGIPEARWSSFEGMEAAEAIPAAKTVEQRRNFIFNNKWPDQVKKSINKCT